MTAFISRGPDGGTQYGSPGEQATLNENSEQTKVLVVERRRYPDMAPPNVESCFWTKAGFFVMREKTP